MADLNDIKKSVENTSDWIANRQAIHISRMTSAVDNLQNSILNAMADLNTNRGGKLSTLRLNLKRMANVHKDVILAFDKDYNGSAKIVTNDFIRAQDNIIAGYKDLDEIINFSGADRETMKILRDSAYKEYVVTGGMTQEKVIQSMYNNVLGGGTMADLTSEIRNSLTGIKGMNGRPLSSYARLFANDMIMNFHNDMNLKKGLDIGMNRFLYYGSLMSRSRDFCKRRVGQTYTKKQIDSWKGSWAGKRGDAWTFRGGWNCRHHWQPVRKKWLDKYDPIEMQNYFTETGQKMPKPVEPWDSAVRPKKVVPPVTPPKVRKPVPKGIVEPGPARVKPVIPTMPTAETLKADIREYNRSKAVTKKRFARTELTIELEKAKVAQAAALEDFEKAMRKVTDSGKFDPLKLITAQAPEQREAFRLATKKATEINQKLDKINKSLDKGKALLVRNKIRPPSGGEMKVGEGYGFEAYLSKEKKSTFAKMKAELETMFHPKVLNGTSTVDLAYEKGVRAYHSERLGDNFIKIGSISESGTGTLIHEFGHQVEASYSGVLKKAQDFLKKRVGNEKLSTIYKGTKERGWKDEFFSHYCGKHYDHGATEIISMGVERMYKDPYAFYIDDKEYFNFILRVMWGE